MSELRTYSVPVFGVPPEVQARADRINADLDELLTPEARERLDLAAAKTYADAILYGHLPDLDLPEGRG